MTKQQRCTVGICFVYLALAAPARTQVGDRLEAYTGRNATGYLSPLVDAFRSSLNSGLFHSAYVPVRGFHASLGVNVISTIFGPSSRTFVATTEGGFSPEQQVVVPTVVGDAHAVTVNGVASTKFAFPGGFNVNNMYFSCPQLTIGSWKGTEAVGRLIVYDTGASDLGRLSVWGVGIRHSVSQYIPRLAPLDLTLAGYWQRAALKSDVQEVIRTEVMTASLQSGLKWRALYPYAGVAVNWFVMDVNYRFDASGGLEPVSLQFRSENALQLTMGVSYQVAFIAAYGEYNLADQNSVAVGLSANFTFSNRSVTP